MRSNDPMGVHLKDPILSESAASGYSAAGLLKWEGVE